MCIRDSICAVIVWPLAFALPNALRAANDVRFTMIVSLLSMWIFRIGFSYIDVYKRQEQPRCLF